MSPLPAGDDTAAVFGELQLPLRTHMRLREPMIAPSYARTTATSSSARVTTEPSSTRTMTAQSLVIDNTHIIADLVHGIQQQHEMLPYLASRPNLPLLSSVATHYSYAEPLPRTSSVMNVNMFSSRRKIKQSLLIGMFNKKGRRMG